ncbi:MAG: hypothetical protein COU35_02845 [Candidatus Magasanikbacteria bacterium CG10_big_fil_rev_8_21_14_0_10_47_10]|uniref:EF-hand domain-containing protein n=1 Tax=Candidatus Magasanikbacteria bacterium CG10_big_fil_rev_8_21_14_0_10_47_10 TaxID=1974652 RepID=A0A2H0TQE2_9BACT|nr:MAG: hypothetical protein COU35_02845 [Candidatus Magasanikbacteria bacterium CG10_big_fil_rev_8_21_14_0_10_47_10]
MRRNQSIGTCIFVLGILFFSGAVQAEEQRVFINSNDPFTDTRAVRLSVTPPAGVVEMRVSNTENFSDGSSWQPIQLKKVWNLSYGTGQKIVYINFRAASKAETGWYSDSIILVGPDAPGVVAHINNWEKQTSSRRVTLVSEYTDGIESVAISNTSDFTGVRYQPISKSIPWILTVGSAEKRVYVRYRDVNGKTTDVQVSITYIEPPNHIAEGTLLKGQTDTVYYLGYDGSIHPFLHSSIFLSFSQDFSAIRHVSNASLRQYSIAEPVCMRQGTWLVKFRGLPRVYAPEPGCELRPIRSEAEAFLLYGSAWRSRLIELDPVLSGTYSIHELTDFSRTEDRDRDGLDRATEARYGTSDTNEDSDNDRVSDYEEIFYWLLDPTEPDTDGDGILDGVELSQGRSPFGTGNITAVPKGTYVYPFGSVVNRWWEDRYLYYYHQDGYVYYLSKKAQDTPFASNKLQSRFVITPPVEIPMELRDGWYIQSDHLDIKAPLIHRNGQIAPL